MSACRISVYSIAHDKYSYAAEILTRLYQQEPSSEQIVIAHHQLVQRLENFLSSLPSGCVDLQKVWTLKTNVLGEGEDTYTQQQYEPEEVVDTAHVMLEYYVSPG